MFLLFRMSENISGSAGFSDELKHIFRRAHTSSQDLFRKNTCYGKILIVKAKYFELKLIIDLIFVFLLLRLSN